MNTQLLAVLATVPLLLCACASTGTPDGGGARAGRTGAVLVPLAASRYNAGQIGSATLLPQDGSTRVLLQFSGVPNFSTSPVHVLTYLYEGSCGQLPDRPAYSLNDQVLVRRDTGGLAVGPRGSMRLSHQAPLPIDELASGRFALALRSAPADGNQLLYCGDLRTTGSA
jgi:hypothetical protein